MLLFLDAMEKLVECVLNVSEGRDENRIRTLANALNSPGEAQLLDCSSDIDHHRAVLTFSGAPEAVLLGALSVFEEAVRQIDLNYHQGVHPRIGAVDVVPFVPLQGVGMEDCVQVARRFGRAVADFHSVPVFLYGEAAATSDRRNLANIRRGEFEGLSKSISEDSARKPDFGPSRLHPTAGATAVGARDLLIAFNIYLDTTELEVAQGVARAVRESSGGLPHVRALGLFLERRGQAQVSMNLTNYKETSLYRAYEEVGAEALRRGTRIASSELVGLVPREALDAGDHRTLMIEDYSPSMILEERYYQVTGRKL
jgi:glutamate formiminotransferase